MIANNIHLPNVIPPKLVPDAFDMFCRHLLHVQALSSRDLHSTKCNLALASLLGIASLLHFSADGMQFAKRLSGNDSVAKIVAWMTFFEQNWTSNSTYTKENKHAVVSALVSMICSLVEKPQLQKEFLANETVPGLVARMWLREDDAAYTPLASKAFRRCFSLADRDKWLDAILKEGKCTADNVADLSLRRFRVSLQPDAPDYDSVYDCIDVLAAISNGGSHHPIRLALLSRQGVPTVTKALVGLSKFPLVKGSDLLKSVQYLFVVLSNMIHSTHGAPWATQAIQSGLLTAFVECAPAFAYFDKFGLLGLKRLMNFSIYCHLVYPSVVAAAVDALVKVDVEEMNNRMSNCTMRDEWDRILNAVLQRAIFARAFDCALKANGDERTCHNVIWSLFPCRSILLIYAPIVRKAR